MNCFKCATPLPDHSKFCMACGADVSGEGHMHETMSSDADPELMAALQLELGSDYTIERELGRGGMAIVYLGQDTHLGRKVAIKLLPPLLTFGSGPGFIERFKREARTSATLDHPHIIPVYRVSTGGKLFWYVMKFLQGESLDETLKRDGKFGVDKVVDVIGQAADALDYAHQSDVVHRDIKPANMMIDKKGWVTVTDFGIAKALNTGTLTGSGAAIGTPHYMSPEQCVGVGVTGASDQYALGVTAYQMLSGDLPFKAESILELMRMHAQDPPPPLEQVRPDLPAGVVEAVERAMAKEPSARFASCGDFARELLRWTKDAEEAARRPTAGVAIKRTVVEAPRLKPTIKPRPDTPAPVTVNPNEPKPKRSPWVLINSALVVVAIIGTFAVYKSTQKPATPSTQLASGNQATQPQKPDSAAATETKGAASASESTKVVAPPPIDPNAGKQPTGNKAGGATGSKTSQPTKGQAKAPPPEKRATPVVTGTAILTVGSRPQSAITINGKPHPDNPVREFEVPAGRVTIRFDVTDPSGAWGVDTVVTLAPGERRNLRFIQLTKKP